MRSWTSTLSLNVNGVLSGLLHSSPSSGPRSAPESSQIAQVPRFMAPEFVVPPYSSGSQPQHNGPVASAVSIVPTGVECIVCTSDAAEVEFPIDAPTSACNHPPQVCVGCLQQIILVSITSGDYSTGILCASPDCAQRLDYYDIQKFATPEAFDRYDKLLLQDSLRTDEHYVLCLEPSCAAGQEHTGGESNNIVTCHSCGTKQCFRHQVLWHEGFTCAQWDEHQRVTVVQQEMSDEWIQANTKPCPRCSSRLEKAEGCDHFTCRPPGGCGHQFCWECLAPWAEIISGDNSRHYDHCSYYSGLPSRNPAPPEIRAASASTRQTSQNVAPRSFTLRPLLLNPNPAPFDVVRAAQTRAPPAANRQAETRRAVLRRHRESRTSFEAVPLGNPVTYGQNRRSPTRTGYSIEELNAVRQHLHPNLGRTSPREHDTRRQAVSNWVAGIPPSPNVVRRQPARGNNANLSPLGRNQLPFVAQDRRVASEGEGRNGPPVLGRGPQRRPQNNLANPNDYQAAFAVADSIYPSLAALGRQRQREGSQVQSVTSQARPWDRNSTGYQVNTWVERPPMPSSPHNYPRQDRSADPFFEPVSPHNRTHQNFSAPQPFMSRDNSHAQIANSGEAGPSSRRPPMPGGPSTPRHASREPRGDGLEASNIPLSFHPAMALTLARTGRFEDPSS